MTFAADKRRAQRSPLERQYRRPVQDSPAAGEAEAATTTLWYRPAGQSAHARIVAGRVLAAQTRGPQSDQRWRERDVDVNTAAGNERRGPCDDERVVAGGPSRQIHVVDGQRRAADIR